MDAQQGFWDATAATAVFAHPIDPDLLLRHVGPDARILDLGCGYGRVLAELWRNGFEKIAGIDTSPAMVERARALVPDVTITLSEGSKLPYDDGAFEAILLFAVLTCTPRDDDQRTLMREVRRLLVPGGVVYLSDYPLQSDARNVARYRRNRERFGRYGVFEVDGGAVLRHHDADWLQQLTAGFSPIVTETFPVTTMRGNPARGFRFLGRKE
jgi:SAM-dependent methyltransferase